MISDVNSELQTTAKRIDELNSKDALSFVEQEELDILIAQNKELEQLKQELEEWDSYDSSSSFTEHIQETINAWDI